MHPVIDQKNKEARKNTPPHQIEQKSNYKSLDTEKNHPFLEELFELSPDAIALLDSAGKIVRVNEGFEKLFGYSDKDVFEKSIEDLIVPDSPKEEYEWITKQLYNQGKLHQEVLRRRKNGQLVHVCLFASKLNKNDEISFFLIYRDISRQKQIEKELKNTKEEVESSNQELMELNSFLEETTVFAKEMALQADMANTAKSEFLANMSHEIRTPMNGILGMSELLFETELTPEQREYLVMVHSSANTLLTLINDLLDFSKIESGRLELEHVEFDVEEVFKEMLNACVMKAQSKGLELICYISPEISPHLKGDPGRIRQILINLVGNAIKFTSQGEITVGVELESSSDTQLNLHFFVRDTGIGIPVENQDKIFEAFKQADGSTTRKFGGTGLGLSICRELVEMMKGIIWVESPVSENFFSPKFSNKRVDTGLIQQKTEGTNPEDVSSTAGTVFHFTVPLERKKSSDNRNQNKETEKCHKKHVLLLEKNLTAAKILGLYFANWGVKSTIVDDPGLALSILEKNTDSSLPIDLILADSGFPDQEKSALIKLAEDNPATKIIPVIFMTPFVGSSENNKDKSYSSLIIKKPILPAFLSEKITEVLSKKVPPVSEKLSDTLRETNTQGELRILLAEDNPVNQKISINILEKLGHTVVLARNGEEAYSLWKESLSTDPFHLILMDVQMPVLDGIATTRKIREAEQEMGVESFITALTAHASKEDQDKCLEAGMNNFLMKPIDKEKLLKVLAQISGIPENRNRSDISDNDIDRQIVIIDEEELMYRMDNDLDLLSDLYDIFVEDYPTMLKEIEVALVHREPEVLFRAAHSIKGTLSSLSALPATESARKLEKYAKENDLDGAEEEFVQLKKEICLVQEYLMNYLQREHQCIS
jgi:two-component system sensor histidine kinase/response regulator